MRVAVVGHVEWIEFGRVGHVPGPGEIVHVTESWEEPGGGGAVSAVQLARLAGGGALYTALGDDELGHRSKRELELLGLRVEAVFRPEPQRRAFVHVDEAGERTITVLGDKLLPRGDHELPWEELHRCDAAYFVSGDVQALRIARKARVLVATSRELPTLSRAGVEVDALVGSGEDEGERYRSGDVEPPPKLVVTTSGALGGWAQPGGPFRAAPVPGAVEDTYGCGDSFAAGLAFGLGRGDEVDEAVELAARCGAAALTGRGAYAGQLAHA
jgi:ribokinase